MRRLTFYMQVFCEEDHGRQTVLEVRRHFPDSRIIVFSDGGPDAGSALQDLDVHFLHSAERTFTRGCLSPHLMLERFLERPTRFLIKVDPDTQIHRPFERELPTGCVFGTVQFRGMPDESIQGGCMGFDLEVAERIFDSKMLLDPRLAAENHVTDDPHLVHLAFRRAELGLGSFDWSIAWACLRLGIPMRDFEDVRAQWQHAPRYRPNEFAITHPRTDKVEIVDDPDVDEIRVRLEVPSATASSTVATDS